MANKTYGSAVLTALQAQHKSIEEIEKLVLKRRIQVFLDGGDIHGWLDCFWHTIAILVANGVRCELSVH